MNKEIYKSFAKLKVYCERESFRGYDPYDGLNSRLFQALPGVPSSRFFRLAWIQFFKRFPFNLRPLAGIQKEYNPKALGIFLSGYCQLFQEDGSPETLDRIRMLVEKILEMKSPGWKGSCWGYNFDWQARAFFQPKGTPTVVASVYIASSLLDAYEITGEARLVDEARSTCDFILNDLNRSFDEKGNYAFSYSPLDRSVVYNASLLGSRLLARVYHITREPELLDAATRSVDYCCSFQYENGSWSYGQAPFHQWIDNFHTGYNLECLADFEKFTGDTRWRPFLEKGFRFYLENFFLEDGTPRYYHNKLYPVDIHNPAQLVITLSRLGRFQKHRELAEKVLLWTIRHMQSDEGYFYYQKNKFISSRIAYMRWAQAWMFYAMATYMKLEHHEKN